MLAFLLTFVNESQREQLTWLFLKFHNDMIRFAKWILKINRWNNYYHDSLDIVQNVYYKIANNNRIDYSLNDKSIKSYLASAVWLEAMTFMSENKLIDSIDDCEFLAYSNEEEFWDSIMIQENYDRVLSAIDKLEPRYSTTLLMYSKIRNVKEIAKIMGLPQKTVYTRIERGRKKLLLLLKEGSYII